MAQEIVEGGAWGGQGRGEKTNVTGHIKWNKKEKWDLGGTTEGHEMVDRKLGVRGELEGKRPRGEKLQGRTDFEGR